MASVDPKELLAHAGWLRQLARSLVHEGADDLVQDTWVAALRQPPHGERGLRPWLRAVIANAARMRWRGDAHRAAREQVAASLDDRDVPSAEHLLERHELQQLLARLVGELDEPFRSTILLRFTEGLTPTQIARRLSIPAGTVRWRLKEALARLRVQLDALHRGDRRAWMLAFGPLAIPRSSTAAPIIPFVLAIAAACAVVVFGAFALRGTSRGSSAPPHEAAARISAGSAHVALESPPTALGWLAQEGAPSRALTGRVVMNGVAVSGATVRLLADPLPAREVRSDARGRFDFGEQLPREYALGAQLPGKLAAVRHLDLRDPSAPHDIELVIGDCVASLHGTVADASGTPIEGAHVLREGVVGAETDRAGNYELCVLPTAVLVAEIRVVVRADGFGTLAIPLAPPGRMRQDFVLAPEATVSGRVLGPNGAPLASARVAVELTAPVAPPERGVSLTSVTDADGAFRIAGLAAGDYRIAAAGAHAVTVPVELTVEAADDRHIELRTNIAGVVRGRVISRGVPVAGVAVAAGNESAISQQDGSFVLTRVPVGDVQLTTTPYKLSKRPFHIIEGDRNIVELAVEPMGILRGTVRRHGVPVPFARVVTTGASRAGVTTDGSGRYELRGLEPGSYGFYCDDRRRGAMFAQAHVLELGPAETQDHDIELAWGGTIDGTVVNARGEPVPGVTVAFRAGMTSQCLTDVMGAFTCGGLAGGSYTAAVLPASAGAHPFRFVEAPPKLELTDGDARITVARFVVEPTLYAIVGTVTDRTGAPVPDIVVHAYAAPATQHAAFQHDLATSTDENGRFRITELSAGRYHVEAERGDLATRATAAAGATNLSLVLDRARCEGAHGHDVPASLTRPPSQIVWNQQIELVGWTLPSIASANESLELTLVFRALRPLDRDWTVFAHFDSQTTRVNADHEPVTGWCPTSHWNAGETIVDHVTVPLAQPGRYALAIGFFTGKAPNWINLPLSAPGSGNTSPTGAQIGDVIVK